MKVSDRLYMIPGAGGNTAVFVRDNGVVLVDTKNPNNGQGILDQVRTVTDKAVTHIINTHTHGDHNGSNVFFPATVEIVTHANTQANMMKMPAFEAAENRHGLPDRTFTEQMTLLSGNDTIDLAAVYGGVLAYRHNGAFTAAGQVRINDIAGADVIVEVNTGGTLAADMQIRLTGTILASMTSTDFVL